ncbi:MAG: hemolysin family protein [Muribaculaceae bacterium]
MEISANMLILTIVSMIFSAFFSGMEIAFVSSNAVRVEIDAAKGGLINKIVNLFYHNKNMFISTMLVGNNIMLVIYGMGTAMLMEGWLTNWLGNEALVLLAQTIISTGIILIVGEFLPKTIFRINPNDSLRTFALPLLLCYAVLYPVSWLSSALSNLLMRMFGIKTSGKQLGLITVGELDAYLQETIDTREDENATVEKEVKIFQNALEFSNLHLRDCMIPRNEIVAIDIDCTSRERLSRMFTETGLSKILVYREDIDNMVGYIHVCELFKKDSDWTKHIKPVMFAPETMLAKQLMQNMLSAKKSVTIVVDEFGGTAGILTLEDLVEEIFGEIEDEHDRKRKKLVSRRISDNVYELSGRLEIEAINEAYDLDIPEKDDYQTLAGYLLFNLEELPNEGETLRIDQFIVTVLKKTAAKIELVRLEVAPSGTSSQQ